MSSEEGVQQGDPLGPLLFCLAVQQVLERCEGDLVMGYLDDLTIGGYFDALIAQVPLIEASSSLLGLTFNRSKCEFLGSGEAFGRGHSRLWFGNSLQGYGGG